MPSSSALKSKGITELNVEVLVKAWLIYVAFFWNSLVIPFILPSNAGVSSFEVILRFSKKLAL